jgi:hypothetical protein
MSMVRAPAVDEVKRLSVHDIRGVLKTCFVSIDETGKVSDAVCIALHGVIWGRFDMNVPEDLRANVGAIWESARCSNPALVGLACRLLHDSLKV